MTIPTVFVIGAGPGDPGLLTARALECLGRADVVVYDHEVHPRILRRARADAELIDVGVAARKGLAQEAICYLLAEKAREGRVVARLKWGDPFIFDRGGEEALFLKQQGLRIEVVPGVPVAVAVPAYAGIPVTYPGAGDTLTVIRGFDETDKAMPDVDWQAVARLDGTVMCYASSHQLPRILDALVHNGCSTETPAAIVYDGTFPTQQTTTGTIGELREYARENARRSAALLVVGRVVSFREHLRWFDERPLFGKRVLVTRPRDQAAELVDRLAALGADAIEAPMIRIAPVDDPTPLRDAAASAGDFDWIVFTSANAVEAFVGALFASSLDIRALKGPKLCAVGTATAERIAAYGIKPELVPDTFTAEGAFEALRRTGSLEAARVLLPRADIGREVLADELRKAGAIVKDVVAYRTVLDEGQREGDPDIYGMLLERQIDVVTFTSGSAARNFAKVYGTEQSADLLRHTVVAAIGPVTAEAAAKLGIPVSIQPATHTIPALVDAIVDYFTAAGSR